MYVFINIKNFIKNNTLMFVLLIIMELFSSLIILFSFGVYNHFGMQQVAKEFDTTLIRISFKQNSSLGEIKEVMGQVSDEILSQTSEIQLVSSYYIDGSDTISECVTDTAYTYTENGPLIQNIPSENMADILMYMQYNSETGMYEQYYKDYNVYSGHVREGRFFSNEDYQSSEKYMAYCRGAKGMNMNYEVGSTVIFCGEEFEVIGRYATAFDPHVAPNRLTFSYYSAPDSMEIGTVRYKFERFIPKDDFYTVASLFEDRFGDNITVNTPEDLLAIEHGYYSTVMLIAVLFIVISAINFSILFSYILYVRNKSISVFRIEGCSRERAVRIFASEFALISSVCFVIGALVYNFILLPRLKPIFEYMDYTYSLSNYIAIFAAYMIIIMFIITAMIKRSIRKTPLMQIRGTDND